MIPVIKHMGLCITMKNNEVLSASEVISASSEASLKNSLTIEPIRPLSGMPLSLIRKEARNSLRNEESDAWILIGLQACSGACGAQLTAKALSMLLVRGLSLLR